jgi:UDP-N-acetylmuramoyl-tripeptide--D-alanyl-D-alanine ligase
MKSALESFVDIEEGTKTVILGDMLELGSDGLSEHEAILNYCREHELHFITVGPIFKGLNDKGYTTTQDLIEQWPTIALQNQLILLKGSRGIALEKILPLL